MRNVLEHLRHGTFPLWAIPTLAALVLSWNCFQFPFLWDDFDFLGRAQHFSLAQLLPDPTLIFYRPLSREIYFAAVYALGSAGILTAHILNFVFLAVATVLLTGLVAELAGSRAGFLAGITFAAFGQVSQLVGFISYIQDLMAMAFMLLALRLRLAGRPILALLTLGAALLSKETALAAVPVLVAFDWILDRKPYRLWRSIAAYGCLTAAWVMIHPGIRSLVANRMQRATGGYIGLENSDQLGSLGKSLVTLLNLPLSGPSTPWPTDLYLQLAGGLAVVTFGLILLARASRTATGRGLISQRRLLVLGSLLFVPPLVLTSGLVGHWSPYYTCFPSVGVAIVLGSLMRKLSPSLTGVSVALWLVLGVWSRAAVIEPELASEKNLKPAAMALNQVERGFRSLHESFPPNAVACVSVQSSGVQSIHALMYRFQAPRIWYRNPTLIVARPDRRPPTRGPEYLFWVTPSLEVFEIDLATLAHRPTGRRENFFEYQKVLRYYAQGLAGSGELDRAVSLLTKMPETDPVIRNMDHRFAVTLLLSEGREREAQSILGRLPPLGRGVSLAAIGAFLEYYSTPGRILDEFVFRAFDVGRDDTEAMRVVMRESDANKQPEVALRLAERILGLLPTDTEAASLVKRLKDRPTLDRITVPIEADSL